MSKVIWKFPLSFAHTQIIEMPLGAKIIHVANQFEFPTMWVIVDPSAPKVKRRFGVIATGALFDDSSVRYVGSFTIQGGMFVGHVVEPNPRVETTTQ